MNYRDVLDRKISAYIAVLIITVIGSLCTLSIVHVVGSINFSYDSQTAALGN